METSASSHLQLAYIKQNSKDCILNQIADISQAQQLFTICDFWSPPHKKAVFRHKTNSSAPIIVGIFFDHHIQKLHQKERMLELNIKERNIELHFPKLSTIHAKHINSETDYLQDSQLLYTIYRKSRTNQVLNFSQYKWKLWADFQQGCQLLTVQNHTHCKQLMQKDGNRQVWLVGIDIAVECLPNFLKIQGTPYMKKTRIQQVQSYLFINSSCKQSEIEMFINKANTKQSKVIKCKESVNKKQILGFRDESYCVDAYKMMLLNFQKLYKIAVFGQIPCEQRGYYIYFATKDIKERDQLQKILEGIDYNFQKKKQITNQSKIIYIKYYLGQSPELARIWFNKALQKRIHFVTQTIKIVVQNKLKDKVMEKLKQLKLTDDQFDIEDSVAQNPDQSNLRIDFLNKQIACLVFQSMIQNNKMRVGFITS